MATLADLFKTCYLTGGSGVEFSAIRLHYRGVDEICRAFGATALTVGSDIYFRQEAFAPHTPGGLRLLAHEVAHVVQQHRGPVTAGRAAGGLAVAPAGSAEEREADAAADALLSGRPFDFGASARRSAAPAGACDPAVHGLGALHARRPGPRAARRGAPGRAVRPARAARPGSAPRRRGTTAGRAPGRGDAAPARQRAGGDARGTERPARLPGPPGGDRERARRRSCFR